jgi:hypothetical protein
MSCAFLAFSLFQFDFPTFRTPSRFHDLIFWVGGGRILVVKADHIMDASQKHCGASWVMRV